MPHHTGATAKLRDYYRKHPDATAADGAAHANCSDSVAGRVLRKVRHEVKKSSPRPQKPRKSKREQAEDYFRKHPNAYPPKVAAMLRSVPSVAYSARAVVRQESQPGALEQGAADETDGLIEDIKAVKRIGVDRVKFILAVLDA